MPVAVVAAEMVRQILLELVVQGVVVTQVQLQTARLERLILAVVVEAQDLRHLLEVQAAPALLSSSTPYQAKPYLRSKALLSGHARQVLPALTILLLRVEVELVVSKAAVAEQADLLQDQV